MASRKLDPSKITIPEIRELLATCRTKGQAQKLRTLNAQLCGCTQCLWALNPATTFAEHEARRSETAFRNEVVGWPEHRSWADLLSPRTCAWTESESTTYQAA